MTRSSFIPVMVNASGLEGMEEEHISRLMAERLVINNRTPRALLR